MKDRQLRLFLIIFVILVIVPILFFITRMNTDNSEQESTLYIEETEALQPIGYEDGSWVKPSDDKLRENLSTIQFEVTQNDGTEPA